MRYLLLFSLLLCLACNDEAPRTGGDADGAITLHVSGAAPGKVVLVGQYMEQQYQADTAVADASGTVTFTPDQLDPGYYFAFYNDQTVVPLLIGDDPSLSLTTEKEDVVGKAVVEGSADTELLYESLLMESLMRPTLSKLTAHLNGTNGNGPANDPEAEAQRDGLIAEREAFYQERFAAHPESFFTAFKRAELNPPIADIRTADGRPDKAAQVAAYRAAFWDNVDFSDPRLLATPVVNEKLARYFDEFVPQRADSVIAAADALLKRAEGHPDYVRALQQGITMHFRPGYTDIMDPEAVFVHMVRNYYTREAAPYMDSMQVYALQNQAGMMDASLVGKPAPMIKAPGADGREKTLQSLRAPYVIVYIYNPECDHCIEETPKLAAWTRQHRSEVDVYAIALSTEDAKWKAFIKEFGIQSWTNVHDPSDQVIFRTYYVDTTPELYLLGPDRKIIGKNLTTEDLDDYVPAR